MIKRSLYALMVLALIAWTVAVIAGTVSMMSDDMAGAKALAAQFGVAGQTPGVQGVTGQFLWVIGVAAVFLWSVPAAAFASCALLLRPAKKAKTVEAEDSVAKTPEVGTRADPVFVTQPQAPPQAQSQAQSKAPPQAPRQAQPQPQPKPTRNPTIVADQHQKAS